MNRVCRGVTATDRFLLLYTSVPRRRRRACRSTIARSLFNAAGSAAELRIDPSSTLLSAAPFTHLYGLFSVNLALTTGATTAIMPMFTRPRLRPRWTIPSDRIVRRAGAHVRLPE